MPARGEEMAAAGDDCGRLGWPGRARARNPRVADDDGTRWQEMGSSDQLEDGGSLAGRCPEWKKTEWDGGTASLRLACRHQQIERPRRLRAARRR
jgi:hypothetical protein